MDLFITAQELLQPIYGPLQSLKSGNGVRFTKSSRGRATLYSGKLAAGNFAELAFEIPTTARRAGTSEVEASAFIEELRVATGQSVNINRKLKWPRVGMAKVEHLHQVVEKLSAFFNLAGKSPRTILVGRSMHVSSNVYFVNNDQAEVRPVFQNDRDTGQGSYRVYPNGGNDKQEDLKITSHEDLAYHAKGGSSIRCLLPSGASSNRSLNSKDVIGLVVDGAYMSSTSGTIYPDRQQKLSAEQLRKVTPEFIWMAVQSLLGGEQAKDFGPSVDYDLLADEGVRLAPKQVFGLAASVALGFSVKPFHFNAGIGTVCFELLTGAGYRLVSKGEELMYVDVPSESQEREWVEGEPKLVNHFRRERAPGIAKAKKAAFFRQHGRLFCESCRFDPSETYGVHAEACIEVHHDAVHVATMSPGHKTTLGQLKCLCANCHRVLHRQFAMSSAAQ